MGTTHTEQISMFGFVDQYETALLPPAERKKGVKAWTIEAGPVGKWIWSHPAHVQILYWRTRPRRIIFERDSKWDDHYKCWDTFGHSLGGEYFGFYGGHGGMPVFLERPSFSDCCVYARQHREYQPGMEIRQWNDIRREDCEN